MSNIDAGIACLPISHLHNPSYLLFYKSDKRIQNIFKRKTKDDASFDYIFSNNRINVNESQLAEKWEGRKDSFGEYDNVTAIL